MKEFPSSIYHLQFGEKFGLREATKILPYLAKLGIEGVYCSPYFASASPHGYDVIDPYRIANPKEYDVFCKKMKKLGLYHIADWIPNHMGIKGDNLWWQDVLEKGQKSPYARFFDIDWSKGKIDLPILGEKGEVKITDWRLPISGFYKLVPWQNSAKEVSYRRFFNINEMVGLRMEDPKVFRAYHKRLFELLKEKKIDGLRIDHPDGLYDPTGYFESLRRHHKGLIVVEKILGWQEELPNWQVEGTVGYEFLNMLTGIFVKIEPRLTKCYERFIGKHIDFADLVYQDKKSYVKAEMLGDLHRLCKILPECSPEAVLELLASFPVYRSYIRPQGPVPERDVPYLKEALAKNRDLFLKKVFSLKEDSPAAREFILRFQQLSAPVMAKGFEDIALYNYNRLLALNEVGGSPERLGVTKEQFHAFCLCKREKWPYGFLATSTHDTKRSHDVRMQLAVLSEIPDKWERALQSWKKSNQRYKSIVDGKLCPDPNAEYMLYQILLGVWPSRPSFKRLWQCFHKSIKEAREYTSWMNPNFEYEKGCEQFLKSILKKGTPFLLSFRKFQKEIARYGKLNSLSSSAFQLGCPGIVDIYQGCENWRYLLVDPDNRAAPKFSAPESEKSRLHRKALQFRKEHKKLFLEGEYIPLEVRGAHKDHVIAYLRSYGDENCLVAVVRFFASLDTLADTSILLPKKIEGGVELFSERHFVGKTIKADQLFAQAPYAWLFWASKSPTRGQRR